MFSLLIFSSMTFFRVYKTSFSASARVIFEWNCSLMKVMAVSPPLPIARADHYRKVPEGSVW